MPIDGSNFRYIWLAVLACGPLCFGEARQYRTTVSPRPGETLEAACAYQLTLPQAGQPVRGVFVIFDRGEQVRNLASDAAVLSFATREYLGVLLAEHCPAKRTHQIAKGTRDLDVIPAHGIGRALIAALDQFAGMSDHPELSRSAMIYFGMSGTGSLAARMVGFIPERTIGSVEYLPDQEDPVGIDTVTMSGSALAVPQFIIANGGDKEVGTARPYAYFEQYRKRGAPLTFLIQNDTAHCCVTNIVPIMLAWLTDVVRLRVRGPGEDLMPVNQRTGWVGTLQVRESEVKEEDPVLKVWNAAGASVSRAAESVGLGGGLDLARRPKDKQVPGSATLIPVWLPSQEFAEAWLGFARK